MKVMRIPHAVDPLGDGKSVLKIIDWLGDDRSVVRAARVSYSRDEVEMDHERDERLIYYLARHGHFTPFEHCVVTFHVKCPLFVARQWMRHRAASYNEVSLRYTELADECDFYTPDHLRPQGSSHNKQSSADTTMPSRVPGDMVKDVCKRAYKTYLELLELGVAREQARMVLPQNLYTRFYYTADLRNLAHFIRLRREKDAQWEIRRYAEEMERLIAALYPVSAEALLSPSAGGGDWR